MRFSDAILLLNTLWFVAAFIQFSIAQGNTLKILVPREERGNPIAPTLSASVAFLGGINLPIGLLSFYLLAARPTFFQAIEAQVALYCCSSPRATSASLPITCRSSCVEGASG